MLMVGGGGGLVLAMNSRFAVQYLNVPAAVLGLKIVKPGPLDAETPDIVDGMGMDKWCHCPSKFGAVAPEFPIFVIVTPTDEARPLSTMMFTWARLVGRMVEFVSYLKSISKDLNLVISTVAPPQKL